MKVGELIDMLLTHDRESELYFSPERLFTDETGEEQITDPGLCVGDGEELYLLGDIPYLDDLELEYDDTDLDVFDDDELDEYEQDDDDED